MPPSTGKRAAGAPRSRPSHAEKSRGKEASPATQETARIRPPPTSQWTGRLRRRSSAGSPSALPLLRVELTDLSADLLGAVVTKVSCCRALLRLGQTCKRLLGAAREPAVWRPILAAFFGGSLPPAGTLSESQRVGGLAATAQAIHDRHPMLVLRDQLAFARALDLRERSLCHLIIPRFAGFPAMFRRVSTERAEEDEWVEVAPGAQAWVDAMTAHCERARAADGAVALAPSRRGQRLYKEMWLQFFGEFVKMSCVHSTAISLGAPPEAATFTHWIRHEPHVPPADVSIAELLQKNAYYYDFGLASEFKDEKLAQIAERQLEGDADAEKARVVRRRLEGQYEPEQDGNQPFDYNRTSGGAAGSSAQAEMPDIEPDAASKGAHVLPKLLAGLYGGYFKAKLQPQEMGVGPDLILQCASDGACRSTINYDNW